MAHQKLRHGRYRVGDVCKWNVYHMGIFVIIGKSLKTYTIQSGDDTTEYAIKYIEKYCILATEQEQILYGKI